MVSYDLHWVIMVQEKYYERG